MDKGIEIICESFSVCYESLIFILGIVHNALCLYAVYFDLEELSFYNIFGAIFMSLINIFIFFHLKYIFTKYKD